MYAICNINVKVYKKNKTEFQHIFYRICTFNASKFNHIIFLTDRQMTTYIPPKKALQARIDFAFILSDFSKPYFHTGTHII